MRVLCVIAATIAVMQMVKATDIVLFESSTTGTIHQLAGK
jgi:hypothetical protein